MGDLSLMFFIAVGWLQIHWIAVASIAALVVVLYVALLASRRGIFNGRALVGGLLIALAIAGIFVLTLPMLTGSSLAQVSYITDWVMLFMMSAGFAGVAFILAYPLLILTQKKKA